jgi:hypothetical protein
VKHQKRSSGGRSLDSINSAGEKEKIELTLFILRLLNLRQKIFNKSLYFHSTILDAD